MVYENRNLAYDLRLFEEEEIYAFSSVKTEKKTATHKSKPEKQNKVVDIKKSPVKRIRRRKNNFFKISCAIVFAVAVVAVVGLIIHGQVQLTELNQQIASAQNMLEEQQSLYTQLEMKVDASISTAVVERYAQEKLNMHKVENSQKEFVNLSQGDKVELTLESNSTVFDNMADAFSSLW